MNPFGQIIDLAGLNTVEPRNARAGLLQAVDPNNPGVDFLQILGGKLSGELPALSGEEIKSTDTDLIVPDEIVCDKAAEAVSAGLFKNTIEIVSDKTADKNPAELSNTTIKMKSDDILGQINQIGQGKISLEQAQKLNAADSIHIIEKPANSKHAPLAGLNLKSDDPMTILNQPGQLSGLKSNGPSLNNINLTSNPIQMENAEVKNGRAVLAEVSMDSTPQNDVDLKSAAIIEKIAAPLNIKNVRLEKNPENNQIDKEPAKLALPTKSYIKVTAADNNINANGGGKHFGDTNQNPFVGAAETVQSENCVSDGEKIRLNNTETHLRVESEPKPAGKIDMTQLTGQSKIISDVMQISTNKIEKIELPESKIVAEPVKFVLSREINGKGINNNHTIMIRMEPDHLGPVRMTISTHSDVMTARLIVDSPLAKATVEANLNNLVEQLDRQGIKVDSFEVSVSGGGIENDGRENRFAGFRGTARKNLKNYEKSTAIDDVAAQRAVEHLYIQSNGVNCFA